MARDGLSVPGKNLANWREEDASLERQINELIQRRSEIKARLDAADLLAAAMMEKEEKSPSEDAKPNGAAEESDSPAVDLVENLRKTGDSLNVDQVRQRLRDLGHKAKADHPKYVYGLLWRLYKGKNPKLLKRGSKYRAAPVSSPEGETEAVVASARH